MSTQMSLDDVLEAQGDWKSLAMQGIKTLAASGRVFQAWDVALLGVPEPRSSAAWGAVFSAARGAGLIRRVGYAPSGRPTVAGSACAEWVGV